MAKYGWLRERLVAKMARNGWLSDVWASLGEIRVPVRYGFAKIDMGG